tara:strand:+ start:34741 stop:35874 length:1134 start_codon:yes stop_codon:yes gene_type:complete
VIPLSVPNLTGNEKSLINKCLETGWVSTAGEYVVNFEKEFASYHNQEDALSLMNGTSALHICLMLSGANLNNHVLTTNITFVATLNSITYTGAEPILFDIDENNWQLDLDLLENFLNEECDYKNGSTIYLKTKRPINSVMIVHNLGGVCDMHRLKSICEKFKLKLIEDAAESLGSTFDNKLSGTFGDYSAFSFNGNKIITTGGGGMILAKNKNDLEKARHLATTAKTDPKRYFHDNVGYNYRLVNILSALGIAQLQNLDDFVSIKRKINSFYEENINQSVGPIFQKHEERCLSNCWLPTARFKNSQSLMDNLERKGIQTRPVWTPMNQLPMYSGLEYIANNDISKKVHDNAVSLPCSTNITHEELKIVSSSINNFYD